MLLVVTNERYEGIRCFINDISIFLHLILDSLLHLIMRKWNVLVLIVQHHFHLLLLKELCIRVLMRHHVNERFAASSCPRSPTDSVNELVTVLRRVILNDPVDIRDVYASSCQISGDKDLMHSLLII